MMGTNKAIKNLIRPEFSIFIFFLLSFLIGAMLSPYFLDIEFLLDSTTIYAELGVIALTLTYLMIAGEIDLSVASSMALVACICARLFDSGVLMEVIIPIGLVLGFVLGLINGLLVTFTGLPSLIITIGTMSMYRGFAQVLIGDSSISGFPAWFVGIDKQLLFNFIPLPLFIFLAIALIMEIILRNTFFGREIYAIGSNYQVARYSGVKVDKIKIILFSFVGIASGIAGLMSMSRLQIARYNIALGGELDIITMVLLGGTAFSGGSGNIVGTMLAFFVIVLIRTAMMLVNMARFEQLAVIGVLLIISTIISSQFSRFSSELTDR